MTKGERSNSVAEGVGKTPTSLFGAQTVPVSTGVGVVAEDDLSQRAFKATREELFFEIERSRVGTRFSKKGCK